MHIYDPVFLFLFFPVFMGIYCLFPAAKRPAVITLANFFFLALAGKIAVIGFIITLCSAYFSGITIYNLRSVPEKANFRRQLLGANTALYAAVFIFYAVSGTGGLQKTVFAPASLYCWVVIPLHYISYLSDVYRGSCEAQTRITSLAAYAGFFPSASFGPVMRYRCFENSFKAPRLSAKKLSAGIKLYILGLAEYLIIARRLEAVRTEIVSAPDSLRVGTGWLFVPIFYFMITVSITGMLHMGRGISLMLGFYVRPVSRKGYFADTMTHRLRELNEPLALWFRDYVYIPIKQSSGKDSTALVCTICAGTLWYSLSAGWLVTGCVIVGLIAAQSGFYKKHVTISKTSQGLVTKLFMFAAAWVCAFMQMPSAGFAIFSSPSGADSGFLSHLLSETAIPLFFGVFASGTLLPELVRRLNYIWLKILVPVVEMLLFIVSISFMLNIA